MQGCCRGRYAGSVADVGCWIVAGVAVQEALRTSDAGLLLDGLLPVFVAQPRKIKKPRTNVRGFFGNTLPLCRFTSIRYITYFFSVNDVGKFRLND